ncbi:MAG: AIR synthase related protein [Microbacteriaceae bacterium]
MIVPPAFEDLNQLANHIRTLGALTGKREIGLVSEVLGRDSWLNGPGDDGAVIPMPTSSAAQGHVIACGEALLPELVATDPFGAGIAAVLANVNDLAAMGAVPLAIVDTIVGTADHAREALRGMQSASEMYQVPLVGGHLSRHDGPPALSAFGLGHATAVLSTTHVAAGQSLIVAACTDGEMRGDFPFFPSFRHRRDKMAGDIRVLSAIAASGACVAAKDVSMAGLVGSLAMLLEWSQLGVTIDLAQLPRPTDVPLQDWLTCFPAFAFLLCAPAGREPDAIAPFHERGLEAAVVGIIDDTGLVQIAEDGQSATVLDLNLTPVTGLHR